MEEKQIVGRRIYLNDTPYAFYNVYSSNIKIVESIPHKSKENNITNNNKIIYKSNYEQREYTEEYLENIKWNLRNSDEKYSELQKEYHKILDKNENLIWVLEGEIKDRNLSNTKCFELFKLIQIYYNLKEIEEKEIFFSGGKEAYFFFKKIGMLK